MSQKIVVFGALNSGKTALVNRLIKNSFEEEYKSTIGVDILTLQLGDEERVQIWDTSGATKFKNMESQLFKNAKIGIFCLDLSESFTNEQIENEINAFKKINPEAPLFLVGTKADKGIAFEKEFETLQKDSRFHCFITSAKEGATQELVDALHNFFKQKEEQIDVDNTKAENKKKDDLKDALNKIVNYKEYIKLYEALQILQNSIADLPSKKRQIIAQEANTLVDVLLDSAIEDKNEAISNFVKNCQEVLKDCNDYICPKDTRNATIKVTLAIAFTSVWIAGLVAFALFFPPGLVFEILLVGLLVTTALIMISAANIIASNLNTLSDYYDSNNRFFKQPSEAVDNVAEKVTKLVDKFEEENNEERTAGLIN